MSIHSKHIRGNLVWYDGQRWFDAVGATVAKFLEDFVQTSLTTDSPVQWTTTLVEAGADETTLTMGTEAGGTLVIKTDENEDDGAQIQVKGESFKLTSGTQLYFGCRAKISDATQSDFFLGLSITNTAILGGVTDSVGFRKVDGTTSVLAMLEKNSSETTGTALTCDTSYHIYEFYFDGTSVNFWVDGTQLTALAQTNLPDDEELTPSIAVLAGAAAVGGKTLTVDWIRCIQLN